MMKSTTSCPPGHCPLCWEQKVASTSGGPACKHADPPWEYPTWWMEKPIESAEGDARRIAWIKMRELTVVTP